jgi:c-di-GMP-binding flagellar brake protein YcgR
MIFKHGLEIALDDSHSKLRATLCGWKPDKYLLIETPAGRNISDNVSLIGRFFHDGCYYGFAVEPMGVLPEAHVFVLKYPDDIIKSSERKNSRLEVALPATVFRGKPHKDLTHNALITDLSAGGLSFSCFTIFTVGETVGVMGALAPEHPDKALSVTVRNMKAEGVKYEYGGEFVFGGEAEQLDLKAKVDKLDSLTNGKIDDEPPPAPGHLSAPVGTRMQFQIGLTKVISTLRGISRKFLFIDTPAEKGKPVITARGASVYVKFAAAGMGYAFETEIVKQYTTPAALWILSNPGVTQSMPLRRNSRLHTIIPSVIEIATGKKDCAIIDLSEAGALLMADGSGVPADTHVTLDFVLPDGNPVKGFYCQVRNARRENGKTYMGLSFADSDPAIIALIKSYCESCSKYLL